MTTNYSTTINWQEEYTEHPDRWVNRGRQAREAACTHYDDRNPDTEDNNIRYSDCCDECDVSEDSEEPMMNYAYPLRGEPNEEEILAVCKETCLTVMENTDTREFFLALCGGGMDLSQDIALAYVLAGERVPDSLAYNVCTQYGMSKSGERWLKAMSACQGSLEDTMSVYGEHLKTIRKAITTGKAIMREEAAKKDKNKKKVRA